MVERQLLSDLLRSKEPGHVRTESRNFDLPETQRPSGIDDLWLRMGGGEEESASASEHRPKDVFFTFASKVLGYGSKANYWPYDNRIIEWFSIWGHLLNRERTGGGFEKSI